MRWAKYADHSASVLSDMVTESIIKKGGKGIAHDPGAGAYAAETEALAASGPEAAKKHCTYCAEQQKKLGSAAVRDSRVYSHPVESCFFKSGRRQEGDRKRPREKGPPAESRDNKIAAKAAELVTKSIGAASAPAPPATPPATTESPTTVVINGQVYRRT